MGRWRFYLRWSSLDCRPTPLCKWKTIPISSRFIVTRNSIHWWQAEAALGIGTCKQITNRERPLGEGISSRLMADGDGLKFKMAAPKQRRNSNEFTSRQILRCEIASIFGVELVVERKIRAGDLHVDQVVHGHSCLG